MGRRGIANKFRIRPPRGWAEQLNASDSPRPPRGLRGAVHGCADPPPIVPSSGLGIGPVAPPPGKPAADRLAKAAASVAGPPGVPEGPPAVGQACLRGDRPPPSPFRRPTAPSTVWLSSALAHIHTFFSGIGIFQFFRFRNFFRNWRQIEFKAKISEWIWFWIVSNASVLR